MFLPGAGAAIMLQRLRFDDLRPNQWRYTRLGALARGGLETGEASQATGQGIGKDQPTRST